MNKRLSLAAIALTLATAAAAAPLAAQTHRPHFGPHISYNFDAEEMGLGLQFSTPISRLVEFYPSFDYYLVDPGSLWALNADLKFRVAAPELNWLYLGTGVNFRNASGGGNSNTDVGVNVLAGFESMTGNVHPFGEMRLSFADGSSVQLAFGLNFTMGGNR